MKDTSSKALLALTAASMALPGMLPKSAHAQAAPDNFSTSYRFSEYAEDEQAATQSANGVVERFDISVHQFSVSGPLLSNTSFNVDLISETLSGASPWFVSPDADGTPIQTLSGATIEESRNEIGVGLNVHNKTSQSSYHVSYSAENDYESLGLSVGYTIYSNEKNTTIDFGFGGSIDSLDPSQEIGITRISDETKSKVSGSFGVSQVVTKTLLVGVSGSFGAYRGFLSDPYKLAFVDDELLPDSRPEQREQAALNLQLRKFLPATSTALHADYRFYADSFGLESNTFSLGAYQNVGSWQASVKVRAYAQSAANFYRNYYTERRADGFYSSDYRLSEFDALSYKIGLRKNFEFGGIVASYEDYSSDGDGINANPGLVDFRLFTIGIDYDF